MVRIQQSSGGYPLNPIELLLAHYCYNRSNFMMAFGRPFDVTLRTRLAHIALALALVTGLALSAVTPAAAEVPSSEKPYKHLGEITVDIDGVLSTVRELASERYAGRLTGTEGNRLATQHIANRFREIGLESPAGADGYMQLYNQRARLIRSVPSLRLGQRRESISHDNKGFTLSDFIGEPAREYLRIAAVLSATPSMSPIIEVLTPGTLDKKSGKVLTTLPLYRPLYRHLCTHSWSTL